MDARCLKQHAGLRLAASAGGMLFVRAIVDRVNSCSSACQALTHAPVHGIHCRLAYQPLGHAALVADHDQAKAGPVQQDYAIGDPGQEAHVLPARDVLILRSFLKNYSITIEKRSSAHGKWSPRPIGKRRGRPECDTPEYAEFRSKEHRCSDRLPP